MTSKPVTLYFKANYMPHKEFADGNKLMRHGNDFAYLNVKAHEWVKLPPFLVETLEHRDLITYMIGPWVFYNHFEKTTEGKYLIKVFPYCCGIKGGLTPRSEAKVKNILFTYGWWVRPHHEFIKVLEEA